MNQPSSDPNRCLNKVFLPSSCCSRNREFLGTGVHGDGQHKVEKLWGDGGLGFKKENTSKGDKDLAFPKL